MKDEFMEKLPESLKIIVRLTDLSTAFILVKNYGGRDLHLPNIKMITPEHELAYLIGFNNLRQICQYWSGDTIYIPKAEDYALHIRDERIRQDSKMLDNNELSKKYGISNRRIRAIKKRQREPEMRNIKDDRQLDMFG